MTDFEKDVIDRLGRIETKLDADYRALHGNGHPGLIDRMATVEKSVEMLKARAVWWRELGGWALAAVMAVINLWIQLKGGAK